MNTNWFDNYFDLYRNTLFNKKIYSDLAQLKDLLIEMQSRGCKVLVMGNGASASIANHISVDFSKAANIRAVNFNEANLITCLANDYGYEEWMAKAIEMYSDPGDVVILISSSGKSQNVLNAAKTAKSLNLKIVTFSGFDFNNPLRQSGDLNIWVDSKAYNIVENTHQIWLLSVCDAIIGKAEYQAS